jgi:hypothetical protein
MGRATSRNGKKRNAYRILVVKPEEKRPLGRPRRRWVDNIKMDLAEIGWDGMDWIDVAQDRDQWKALRNTVMNLQVPQYVEKFLGNCISGCFSTRAHLHGVRYMYLVIKGGEFLDQQRDCRFLRNDSAPRS